MPEYLSPGVYVEEVDAGPKPIEGVSTSTAGAIGVTVRGPTTQLPWFGKPVLVTSFADYTRKFGGYHREPITGIFNRWALDPSEGGRWWNFPLSVKAFFDNGGQRLYVKRIVSSTATEATISLGQGFVSELADDAQATDDHIRLRHLIDIDDGTVLNLFAAGTALPNNPFTVLSYNATTGTATLDQQLGQNMIEGRDIAEIHARAIPGPNPKLVFTAKSVGLWGNDLSVRVRPMVGAVLTIRPDPGGGGAPASTTLSADMALGVGTITVNNIAGFADTDVVLIDGNQYTIQNPPAGNSIDILPVSPEAWPTGTAVKRLRPAQAPGPTINVSGASQLYVGALVELDNGTQKENETVLSIVGDEITLGGAFANNYHETQKLRVVEAEVSVRYRPDSGGATDEVFQNLRLHDDGTRSYLVNHVNERSELVDVARGLTYSDSDLLLFPSPTVYAPDGTWTPDIPDPPTASPELWLVQGADNHDGLTVDDFVGTDGGSGNRTGLQALQDIEEISIVLSPGMWSTTIQSAVITHCETQRYRFAILDPQNGLPIQGIRDFRERMDSKYAALYYPWVELRDPSLGRNVIVAPSGHMAGIYARVDVERGVHKAPANEVIRSITQINQEVTKREQDLLNPVGINALRFFPNRGNRVWGARCVTSDSAWKYINVRRLFIFVEHSIDRGTQWVVFEPNDHSLWARVRQTITNFLTTVWRSGALFGNTAEEAFFVRCDETTMTADDIDNGRLICVIGIAPVKPAEFVIFRIQQKTLELE